MVCRGPAGGDKKQALKGHAFRRAVCRACYDGFSRRGESGFARAEARSIIMGLGHGTAEQAAQKVGKEHLPPAKAGSG